MPDYEGSIAELRQRLESRVAQRGTGSFARFDALFTSDETSGRMELAGGLRLAAMEGGGFCTTAASTVGMNLIEFLRDPRAPDSPRGLDGRTNFVDVRGASRSDLLAVQLAGVAAALDDLVGAMAEAAGGSASAQFSLRQVEVNRDLSVPDARRVAHALKHAPNPWYRVSESRHYAPHADLSLDGNDVTVTWSADAADLPVRFKFYAKRPDRLRTEVCFDNAAAVAATLSGGRRARANPAADDGAELAGLLRYLAAACVPYLDAMGDHVAAVTAPQVGPLELMAALAPLLQVTAPPPPGRPGRPAGARTRAEALDALFHLLEAGRFDASALHTNTTARKALNRIAAEGGLLAESRGRAALFTIPPSMLDARRALAGSLWPRGGTPRDGER